MKKIPGNVSIYPKIDNVGDRGEPEESNLCNHLLSFTLIHRGPCDEKPGSSDNTPVVSTVATQSVEICWGSSIHALNLTEVSPVRDRAADRINRRPANDNVEVGPI